MKIAFFGDIVGKTGRTKLESALQEYISEEKIDFVVANAENATSGAGLSARHAEDLLNGSVNCITLGDHAFDNKDIIPLGSLLRRFKIDELPQLLNILLGDMSFVGPRPEIKEYVDLYDQKERISLTVKPGITDYSSIKFISLFNEVGEKSAHDYYKKYVFKEKNRLRIKYVRDISFLTDLKILFLTFYISIIRLIKN